MDGILLLNKTERCTSFELVKRAKRALGIKKIGHGGTLDPFAGGLLILLLGKGTRLFGYISELDKSYTGTVILGVETDTYDREGNILFKNEGSVPLREEIEEQISSMRGKVLQSPPKFSAVKINGKRAYELARKGLDFSPKPREVMIYDIWLMEYNYPSLTLTVKAGKGFYMRSLAHELGQRLGTGAHLYGLIRNSIGPFTLEDAVDSDQIEVRKEELPKRLLPLERVVEMIEEYKNKEEKIGLYKRDQERDHREV
ncbi:MAG: tRNA pseudouridine(55) synthase TruB [Desulfatiglandales bacterium]